MKQTLKNLPLLLAAAGLAACLGRGESSVGTEADPLVVVLSPSHIPEGWVANPSIPLVAGAPESALDPKATLEQKLSEASGLKVSLAAAASPVDAVERLGARKADAGILSVDEFLLAHEEHGVRAGLQVLRGKGETRFDGVILVKVKGGARKAADLAGRKFGFVDPYSVSGFLLPARFLEKEGVKVESVFLGSHRKALRAVANITGFGPAEAGDYRAMHELLREAEKTVYDIVPDGAEVRRLSQPYIDVR